MTGVEVRSVLDETFFRWHILETVALGENTSQAEQERPRRGCIALLLETLAKVFSDPSKLHLCRRPWLWMLLLLRRLRRLW